MAVRKQASGKWLYEIEGKTSVRDLSHIPASKVHVSGVDMTWDW